MIAKTRFLLRQSTIVNVAFCLAAIILIVHYGLTAFAQNPMIGRKCVYVNQWDARNYLDTCIGLNPCQHNSYCLVYHAPFDYYCWGCSTGEGECACQWSTRITVPGYASDDSGGCRDGTADGGSDPCYCRYKPRQPMSLYLYLCCE